MAKLERSFCVSLVLALAASACSSDGSDIYASVASGLGGGSGGDVSPATTGSGGSSPVTTTGDGGSSSSTTGGGSSATTTTGSGGSGGSGETTGAGGSGGSGTMMQADAATGGQSDAQAPAAEAGSGDLIGTPFKMLVFTKASAFVHDSIPVCVQMLKDMSAANKYTVTETADAGAFTDANLKMYDEVFFVSTTGGIFSDAGAVGVTAKAAFQKYMENGGAYAGVHAATDCERDGRWPWYEDFMGALWNGNHDNDGTPGTVILQAVDNPAIRGLPANWVRPNGDEWYHQTRALDGRPGITVLAKLNTDQRPVSWIHELPGGGRMFYTIQGHNKTHYAEDNFKKHILGGLLWAAKRAK